MTETFSAVLFVDFEVLCCDRGSARCHSKLLDLFEQMGGDVDGGAAGSHFGQVLAS